MSKLTNQWIELFRAGKHAEQGKPEFSTADLDQIVANYQPKTGHEAPATIGHPKGDAPAWAWFDGLKRQGDLLLGKMGVVQPEFEEMVEKKLFPKRSVGLVKGENGWGLHHVAFLGAKAPAIKGLADCKFEAGSADVVEIMFEEDSMAAEETVLAQLKAWFEERFPKTAAVVTPTTFSEADVKRIATEAVTAAVAPLQTALDAQKTEFAERDKKLVTTETTARAEAAIAKVKAVGRWLPAFEKMGLGVVFAELAKTTASVEFGEGDAKKTLTPLDMLVAFMEQLPKVIPTGEVYTSQMPQRKAGASRFAGAADANSVLFDEAIRAYATEHKVDYTAASLKVAELRPELTIPGGASSGAV